jgi:DNA segregation ATPase FtsK/SpoIIIE-like protein
MIDELADLMMSSPDQTEHAGPSGSDGEATGIHKVIATSDPAQTW